MTEIELPNVFEVDLVWQAPRRRQCSLAPFAAWDFAGNWCGRRRRGRCGGWRSRTHGGPRGL